MPWPRNRSIVDTTRRLSRALTGRVQSEITAPSPTVFTLTLDDLSTNFVEYDGAAASIKFKLTTTDGGGSKTTSSFVYIDSSQGSGLAANTLDGIGDVATLIETQLNALSGYSGVTVDGAETTPSDRWDFTITFPSALGVTDLDFHASSRWYPAFFLEESASIGGVPDIAATAEVFRLTCTSPNSGTPETVNIDDGDVSFENATTTITSVTPPSGYSVTSGGSGFSFVEFTADTPMSLPDAQITNQTADGTYSIEVTTQGLDSETGSPEVHSIVTYPVNPTGGTFSLGGETHAFDKTVFDPLSGFTGAWSKTAGTSLADGGIEFTCDINGEAMENELAADGANLTAPEITHSIS